jgi:hydroxyethylthiazole kinase-like uncharacterized protein yjeF
MNFLTPERIKSILKKREERAHKGDFGHALLIVGNTAKMGAAVIVSRACLRSGVGLLNVCVPKEERVILQTSIPEAMLTFREEEHIDYSIYDSIGMGPGMGVSHENSEKLREILLTKRERIVLDADALMLLSMDKYLLNQLPVNTILTPHNVEFDRIFGDHSSHEERIKTAIIVSKKLGIIIVLKGHQSLITSASEFVFNTTGNAGLAKGGSGDALLGTITSFLAQGYLPFDASILGVYIHGLAADLALSNQSVESLLITDVIECYGQAFKVASSY